MVELIRRRLRSDESGFTLVELLAAMVVFTIFVAILLTSVIGITRASSRAQLLAQSSSSVLSAFQTFDHQIRYANAINYPGTGSSGARYIEFRTGTDSSTNGLVMCTQWRYVPSTKIIQYRSWQDVVGASASAVWSTKIIKVVDLGGANYPFKLIPASLAASTMQQLVLTVSSGTDLVTPGAAISSTFVARNSSISSPSNSSTVVAGASDTPVCLASGTRP
jgi:prepilin-type N-terminal cleavage/methylation domain-containing protein